jgi:hypothetical protein
MKKSFGLVLILMLLVLFAWGAMAATFRGTGNPDDTLAGTPITSESASNTMNYKDSYGNTKEAVLFPPLQIIVGADAGFSAAAVPEGDVYSTPGSTEVWTMILTNEGNVKFTVVATSSAVSVSPSGGHWLTTIEANGTTYAPGQPVGITLEEDSDFTPVTIKIWSATTETDAPEGSTGTVTYWFDTPGYTYFSGHQISTIEGLGYYTGANDLTYGQIAGSISGVSVNVQIQAPVVTITKTATVDSPLSYRGWGGVHDLVPGSVITYTIAFSNEGTAQAKNIAIVDRVPAPDCVALGMNLKEDNVGMFSNVNITAPDMFGNPSWWVLYSTEEAPPLDYFNPLEDFSGSPHYDNGWVYGPGAIAIDEHLDPPYATPGAFLVYDADARFTMKWVKFETATIEAGDYGTIQWQVMVK